MEHIIIGHSFEITLDTENSSLLALKVFLKKFPSLLDTCKDVHICCLSVSNKPSLTALLPSSSSATVAQKESESKYKYCWRHWNSLFSSVVSTWSWRKLISIEKQRAQLSIAGVRHFYLFNLQKWKKNCCPLHLLAERFSLTFARKIWKLQPKFSGRVKTLFFAKRRKHHVSGFRSHTCAWQPFHFLRSTKQI